MAEITSPQQSVVPVQITAPNQQVAPTPTLSPVANANVQNFLQQYQPTPAQVYSPTNVQQAITQPQAAPNLADPLGLYNYYMSTPEVTQSQQAFQQAQQRLSQFDTQAQKAQLGLEGQTVSLNVIRGEQAQLAQQAAATRQGLASEALVAQSAAEAARQRAQEQLQIAQQSRQELTSLITQYPGAKITYADTPESAAKKIEKYQAQVAKDAYKEELKKAAMQLGLKSKGSTKDIEKRISGYYKDQKAYEKQIQQLEIAAKRKALSTPSGGSGVIQGKVLANAQSALLGSRGSDGKADPNVYTNQRAAYMNAGGSSSDFDSQFGGLLSYDSQQNLGVQYGTAGERKTQAELTQQKQKASESAQKALDLVKELQTSPGKKASVGVKGITGGLLFGKTIPGTKAADFQAKFDSLKSLLTIENMGIMKGVLSDSDMRVIQQASTALNRDMSESEFDKELKKVKTILETRIGEGQQANMSDQDAYALYLNMIK